MSGQFRLVRFVGFISSLAIAIVLVWGIGSAIQSYRYRANLVSTKNDVKQIMLAMHQYHDAYNSFPPAFVVGPDGKRWHSWRALILPYLDSELAKQYRFDEPWDGPHNQKMLAHAPGVFRSDCVGPPANATSYFAVVGKRTLWPADQALKIRDIFDGTSNTVAIVEDSRTDIQWLEPKDLLHGEFFHSFYEGKPWMEGGGRTVGLADGSARFLSTQIERAVLNSLLTPSMGIKTYRGSNWPADLVDGEQGDKPQQKLRQPVSLDTLRETIMLAAASQQMDSAKNSLWAATFQIAWDELKKQVDGHVVSGRPNAMLEQLNASSYDIQSLSPESRGIGVTSVSDDSDDALRNLLATRFPDVEPPLNDIPLQPGQWGIRLYAMVRKSMPFEVVLDRFSQPLEFVTGKDTIRVNSFGHDPGNSIDGRTFEKGQITVLDDRGDDNFIVQLETIGAQQDKIILALVPADATLEATWLSVRERIQHPNLLHSRPSLDGNETLQIPVLNFSLKTHFAELEGQFIEGFDDPAHIALAYQDIRLRLDETGAEFLSYAEVGVIGEFGDDEVVEYKPQRIRRLILNKPFFIAMQEKTGTQPWFMGWIANGELMEVCLSQAF